MKPKIIIVNEDDQILGYKPRELVTSNEMYRVSALWLKNSNNEFLLAQRSFKKKNDPGKWGPAVAGTVEKNETYEENIIKEAEEELGLKNFNFTTGPKLQNKGKNNHFTQWYFLSLDRKISDFSIQKEEVESIKWFSQSEFLQLYNANLDAFLYDLNKYVELFN